MSEEPKNEESVEEQFPVRKVCAWCREEMGDAGFTSSEKGKISHGMCHKCLEKHMKELENKNESKEK